GRCRGRGADDRSGGVGRVSTIPATDDPIPAEALTAVADLLGRCREPIAAALFAALAEAYRPQPRAQEAEAQEAARVQRERQAAVLAEVAAEADGAACALDGGPSSPLIGAREWLAAYPIAAVEG